MLKPRFSKYHCQKKYRWIIRISKKKIDFTCTYPQDCIHATPCCDYLYQSAQSQSCGFLSFLGHVKVSAFPEFSKTELNIISFMRVHCRFCDTWDNRGCHRQIGVVLRNLIVQIQVSITSLYTQDTVWPHSNWVLEVVTVSSLQSSSTFVRRCVCEGRCENTSPDKSTSLCVWRVQGFALGSQSWSYNTPLGINPAPCMCGVSPAARLACLWTFNGLKIQTSKFLFSSQNQFFFTKNPIRCHILLFRLVGWLFVIW